MSEYSDRIRIEWAASDARRDKGLCTPDNIVRYDDICYGDDSVFNRLDVYRPNERANEYLPVIISVHGGAFVYGDKELYQYYCMDLAKRGYAVINFSYRLAPEAKHPAQIEDMSNVISWMMNNADRYKLDIKNVFAVGDSAGGNLLGVYSNIYSNEDYAKLFNIEVPKGFHFNAIAINCGLLVLNDKAADCGNETDKMLNDLFVNGGSEDEKKEITVTDHVTSNFPPTFIMTAQEDFLKKQAGILATKLVEKNVPFEFRFYVDKNEVLTHVFHVDIRLISAIKCNDDECDFFKSYIVE